MIALVCVLTMVVRIPTPTRGYLNLGDSAVLFCGWLLGPLFGPVAAGVGSALADLFSGYPVYIPGTFFIKAAMALFVSVVSARFRRGDKPRPRLGFFLGAVIAELVMIGGYYLYEAVVIGEGFSAALAGVAGNAFQAGAGIGGAILLIEAVSHTGAFGFYGVEGFTRRETQ